MVLRQSDAIKYPWLPSAREFVRASMAQDVREFVETIPRQFPDLYDQLRVLVEHAVQRAEQVPHFPKDDDTSLVLYPFLKIFLILVDDNALTYQVANTFSKNTRYLLLEQERPRDLARKLPEFARDLDWDLQECRHLIHGQVFRYKIRLTDYIKYSVLMRDPNWKLTNVFVEAGFVFMDAKDLTRLLEEHVKWQILDGVKADLGAVGEQIAAVPSFAGFVEEVKELLSARRKEAGEILPLEAVGNKHELFPPCIRVVYQKAIQGQNLSHLERLVFAFFLLNLDYTVDEILEIFKQSPDYNEDIARYQLEHAAGKRGRGVKYNVHSCAKLQSYQLCYAKDPDYGHKWCAAGKVKNPMSFVKMKLWVKQKFAEEAASTPGTSAEPHQAGTPAATPGADPGTKGGTENGQ